MTAYIVPVTLSACRFMCAVYTDGNLAVADTDHLTSGWGL